jgi:hypothetical protein
MLHDLTRILAEKVTILEFFLALVLLGWFRQGDFSDL